MTDWLIVAGDFVPTGGMDRANLALARYLARMDRVELVTHRVDPELAKEPNICVRSVRRPFGSHLAGGWWLDRAGRQHARLVVADGGRVIVNGGNCLAPAINWLHYVHAADRTPAGRGIRGWKSAYAARSARRSERAAVQRASHVVGNSRLTVRHAVELLGVPADRAHAIYYGTDPQQFALVSPGERADARREFGWSDRPWALFVGGLGDRRKGFDTLYAAWRTLCSSPTWDANLAVVGRGAELPEWQARAAADGLAARIAFLGFRTDVPKILAAADVVVHPARYEPYGLGVHEALCRGLPAIVSASAGVAERYPANLHDLLLTDPENVGELAVRLLEWRANLDSYPDRVRPFADALRSRTWDEMAAEIVAIALTP